MTVAVLVIAIALPMLLAAWRETVSLEIMLLAVGSSTGLLAIDVIYVMRKVIALIYLADALLEGLFLLAWSVVAVSWLRSRHDVSQHRAK